MSNYFKWVFSQIKSINKTGKILLSAFFALQLFVFFTAPITTLSIITLCATLIGASCTVYMMLGKPINGLLGSISAIGFIIVNWSAGHYASVLDQVIFITLIDIPLMLTWKNWDKRIEGGAKFLSKANWMKVIAGMIIAWPVFDYVYQILGDTNPFWDAIVLIIGATASILVYRGYGDSYTLWLLSNVVTIALWFTATSYSPSAIPMVLTMGFYAFTAIYGKFFSVWKKVKN